MALNHSFHLQLPIQNTQVLSEHCDEVWYVKFSPDGLKLASGSKDTTVIVWDVEPEKNRVKIRRTLDGHSYGISFLKWSPDSKYLLVGGPEDCPNAWLWNIESSIEEKPITISNSNEDSLTSAAFNHDGTKFVIGGCRGQFYMFNLNGEVTESWDGVRVTGLGIRSDNKTILASDTHKRIRTYTVENPRMDCTMYVATLCRRIECDTIVIGNWRIFFSAESKKNSRS